MGSVTRGASITLAARVLALAIGIVASVILARALGPAGRGIYALIILIPTLLQFAGGLGIESSATYLVARRPDEARGIVLTLVGVAAGLGLVLIALYAGLSAFPPYLDYLREARIHPPLVWILVALLPLILASGVLAGGLLGLERYRAYNLATLTAPAVNLAVLLALLAGPGVDVAAATWAIAASQAAGAFAGLALILATTAGPATTRGGVVREAVGYGARVHLGNVAWFLHYRADMFLVGYLAGPAALGFYAVAVGLAEKLYLAPSAVGTVLFPRVAAAPDQEDATATAGRHTLWLTMALAVALGAAAWPLVRLLYGADFLPAVTPLWLLLPGVAALALGRVLSADLNGRGQPGAVAAVNGAMAALNIGLNLLWIPIWGAAGAAAATTVSYTCAVAMLGRRYLRESGRGWGDLLLLRAADRAKVSRSVRSLAGSGGWARGGERPDR